jgi:hypothetical protein
MRSIPSVPSDRGAQRDGRLSSLGHQRAHARVARTNPTTALQTVDPVLGNVHSAPQADIPYSRPNN